MADHHECAANAGRSESATGRTRQFRMEHQASVDKIKADGQFDVPFDTTAVSFPIGVQPLLCKAAHIHLEANKGPRIHFESAHEGGFEVQFDPTLLHGLCTMLQQVVKSAEWDIELNLPNSTAILDYPQGMLN